MQDLLDAGNRRFTVPSTDFIPSSLPTSHFRVLDPLPNQLTLDLTRMIEKLQAVASRWHSVLNVPRLLEKFDSLEVLC